MKKYLLIVPVVIAMVTASISLAFAQSAGTPTTTTPDQGPDCSGYEKLAKQTYRIERWWQIADPTPASKNQDRRLDAFREAGCPKEVRAKQKHEYANFYDDVITKCGAFANCAVAACESGGGTAGPGNTYLHGFTVYWTAESPLPTWYYRDKNGNIKRDSHGNKLEHTSNGTRFAPSEPSASRYEQNVFAWAAFKFGPTPSTCAS